MLMRYFVFTIGIIVFVACSITKENKWVEEEQEYLFASVPYNQVAGVAPNLLSLDVYYTDQIEEEKPVVIWVHGGAWVTGDKANKISNKVQLFQSKGYVFVSINYRLSPFPYAVNDSNRLLYPIHNNDVADAIQWVYQNIAIYGGDANKLVLLGHSAGAHLVSLTGTKHQLLMDRSVPMSAIKGVASIDTKAYDVAALVAEDNEIYINAFGNDEDVCQDASPLYHLFAGQLYPPFFIGKRGSAIRLAANDVFITKLREVGVTVTDIEASEYSHAEINDAIGEAGEQIITPALLVFMEECFE